MLTDAAGADESRPYGSTTSEGVSAWGVVPRDCSSRSTSAGSTAEGREDDPAAAAARCAGRRAALIGTTDPSALARTHVCAATSARVGWGATRKPSCDTAAASSCAAQNAAAAIPAGVMKFIDEWSWSGGRRDVTQALMKPTQTHASRTCVSRERTHARFTSARPTSTSPRALAAAGAASALGGTTVEFT